MSRNSRQLDRLIARIDSTPYGPDERALIDEAIALADESGEVEKGYSARSRLISSASHLGDTEAMFTAFAWCLGMHDKDPVRFPISGKSQGDVDLLWVYKWMIPRLAGSPIFSRQQILESTIDMERRYAQFAAGWSGVLSARLEAALGLGDFGEAEKLRVGLAEAPRDSYSDCAACVAANEINVLVETDRGEDALVALDSMLDNNLSCTTQPEGAIAATLLPLLRSGNSDQAVTNHLRAYRLSRENPDNLGIIARHVLFCSVSGNFDRGITLVERHFGWLTWDSLADNRRFDALAAFAVLLYSASRNGRAERPVRVAASTELSELLLTPSANRSVSELAEACWLAAERLAGRFDLRNQNRAFSTKLERYRALITEQHRAPIGADTPLALPEVAPLPQPSTAMEWFFLSRELWSKDDHDSALDAALKALETATGDLRATLLLTAARINRERNDHSAAQAAMDERHALLESLGRTPEADMERRLGDNWVDISRRDDTTALEEEYASGRITDPIAKGVLAGAIAIAIVSSDSIDRALNFGLEAVAAYRALNDEYAAARFSTVVAQCLVVQQKFDEAAETLDSVAHVVVDRSAQAHRSHVRSQIASGHGDSAAALAFANEALAIAIAIGGPKNISHAAMVTALMLARVGRFDEAAGRGQLALRNSEVGEGRHHGQLKLLIAENLLSAGRPDEALETLVELYESRVSLELDDDSLLSVLTQTASALAQIGNWGASVGAWKDAAAHADRYENYIAASACEDEAAGVLINANEFAQALELAESARTRLKKHKIDEPGLLLEILISMGFARCYLGQKAGLKHMTDAVDIARGMKNPWLEASATRRLGLGYLAIEDRETAVSTLLTAADAFAATDDAVNAASCEASVAHALVELGRKDEGVAIFKSAVNRLSDPHPMFIALSFDLARLLDELGRPVEAEEVRSAVSGAQ